MKSIVVLVLSLSINLCAIAQVKNQADWQQRVDYNINVSLDDVAHQLDGDITMNYTNNSPDELGLIYIHLWPNGYKNNSTAFAKQMRQNGEMDFHYSKAKDRGYLDSIQFSADGKNVQIENTDDIDVIKILLPQPLKSGQSVTLKSPFRVKLPKVFSRLGHQDQDYFITQWYPKPAVYDVNGWNPMPYLNMGEFYSEFGSFEVNITLPDNYTLVATGECQNEEELSNFKRALGDSVGSSQQLKTVKFTADRVHDFAWFASKRWGYVTKKVKVEEREITARVVAAEPNVSDLEHIQTAVDYYSEHVGPYPYSHVTVVHGELKAGGGMEYPMITLCDFMNEEVIVHEVGHNWFYGILANNERRYPWMDESINSYYEGQAMAKGGSSMMSNANSFIMNALVKDNLLQNKHQAIATSSEELTNSNYGMSVYGIGAQAFDYLKAYLGDELFKSCMTSYYEEWKFKHPLPSDMKNSWESTSGKELDWFFDDMLEADSKLDFSVKKKSNQFQLTNKSEFKAPIPLEIERNDEKSTSWHLLASGESIEISIQDSVRKAVIDPNGRTLDLHLGNNSSINQIKLKPFTGRNKPDITEVYMMPAIGWNAYDKTMLGLGVHNYSVSNKPFQYHLMPMYAFGTKTLTGVANFNYVAPMTGPASYIEVGADIRRFSINSRLPSVNENLYSYNKLAPYVECYLPKKSHRSLVSRKFRFQYDHINFSPQFEVDRGDTLSGSSLLEGDRQFFTLSYFKENKRKINGYSLELLAEYGSVTTNTVVADFENPGFYDTDSIRRFFPYLRDESNTQDMLRLSTLFNYDLDLGLKEKPLEIRVYASYLVNAIGSGIYQNTIGSTDKAGYFDYRMDDYLLHRNAEYGLFQHQISNRRDFSKFVGPILQNETWMATVNVTVPLPGKFPVKPYVEFLLAEDLDQASWNTTGAGMIYNGGLELEIVPDHFEIFFNLFQSSDITDYQEGLVYPANISSFGERITFVLDLNGLRPDRVKKQLKLF